MKYQSSRVSHQTQLQLDESFERLDNVNRDRPNSKIILVAIYFAQVSRHDRRSAHTAELQRVDFLAGREVRESQDQDIA